MISWEEYFLNMAKTCASRSNCLRAQVGAVIVGEDKKIKATGYNGTPSKVESCYERGECYRIKNNILFPYTTLFRSKLAVQFTQNKTPLSKLVKTVVWAQQCTFGDIILFVFYANDSFFKQASKKLS